MLCNGIQAAQPPDVAPQGEDKPEDDAESLAATAAAEAAAEAAAAAKAEAEKKKKQTYIVDFSACISNLLAPTLLQGWKSPVRSVPW